MLTGDRSAITKNQVGGCFHEFSKFSDALFRLEIKIQARVDAGVAEVAVERAFVAEVIHQLAQVAKIGAEFFRSDGGVFPSLPVQRLAGDVRGDTEARLANFPDSLGLFAGTEANVGWSCAAVERCDQGASQRFGFFRGRSAELD